MKNNLKQDQEIFFIDENLPMKARAISDRYAVCTRKLNWIADNDLLMHKVRMEAYITKKQAYHALKDYPVYSLLDFKEMKKSPDNYGGKFDYNDQTECEECILELISGKVELSSRHVSGLKIDWKLTEIDVNCPGCGSTDCKNITDGADGFQGHLEFECRSCTYQFLK